ncbi:hypothetical protein XENTR_v10016722 [Xenopus tropicalis]|uniref:Biogenesis of lysosomal organelles complex-1, subunit 4, cappuccino n=1 Tax=Xenopus tropicalis TaxID=8364 RepID=Q28J65_XENTR|nr:biogenesis of lysosomal organelles complex-1, subunit 4, cappuccino [Xenopus tropicalis]KAE8598096.1 hypothetical protein XENTR_v10016722 [Xenopus tropicalis]CAJ83067.1 cappuccino homolog (mouse) [Xenopus tropicalis]|eukprot:NP_001037953.1 biogenesis of lysosomal organelles complex-1, subunit 4, cappuccino [Xenopus tropicalis]
MEEVAAVGGSGHWEAIEEEDLAGVPSQSPIDSGCVSQSLSAYSGTFASLLTEEPQDLEQLIKSTSTNFSSYLLPDHSGNAEIQDLDKSLEDLLIRVDEFVGMLDMIRNDTSQVVNERIPQIHTKAAEMRHLYKKIDLLEAFVKMVGGNVTLMEEHIAQAETSVGSFSNPFKKMFQNISSASFFSPPNKQTPARSQHSRYEPPSVFKTDDFFPSSS